MRSLSQSGCSFDALSSAAMSESALPALYRLTASSAVSRLIGRLNLLYTRMKASAFPGSSASVIMSLTPLTVRFKKKEFSSRRHLNGTPRLSSQSMSTTALSLFR